MFIIAKFADIGYWPHYYYHDPKVTGLPVEAGMHLTERGQIIGLGGPYNTTEEASGDLEHIRSFDPVGGYEITPVKAA